MSERKVLFGTPLDMAITQADDVVRGAVRADRTGLDLVTIPDRIRHVTLSAQQGQQPLSLPLDLAQVGRVGEHEVRDPEAGVLQE
jgi:hypothetical protein